MRAQSQISRSTINLNNSAFSVINWMSPLRMGFSGSGFCSQVSFDYDNRDMYSKFVQVIVFPNWMQLWKHWTMKIIMLLLIWQCVHFGIFLAHMELSNWDALKCIPYALIQAPDFTFQVGNLSFCSLIESGCKLWNSIVNYFRSEKKYLKKIGFNSS